MAGGGNGDGGADGQWLFTAIAITAVLIALWFQVFTSASPGVRAVAWFIVIALVLVAAIMWVDAFLDTKSADKMRRVVSEKHYSKQVYVPPRADDEHALETRVYLPAGRLNMPHVPQPDHPLDKNQKPEEES